MTDTWMITLPDKTSELNDYMCGPMKRKGRICSECIDGYGPSYTSFGLQCSSCTGVFYGILYLLLVEVLPQTVFFLIVLMLRIRMTSAPMTCFILYSHSLLYIITRSHGFLVSIQNKSGAPLLLVLIECVLYGIWNLNFIRYIVPPFCISEKLSGVHIHLLAYIFTLYPIFLVFITWFFVRLYDSNCQLVVILCKPFVYLFAHLRRGWSIRNDIIDVFATFFLLSFTKLSIESLFFIRCGHVYTSSNTSISVALSDQTISCYSKEQIPYALLGYITLFFLVALILLLILYPFKIFRAFLSRIGIRKDVEIIITMFVDRFYDCYRDGLNGGRDLRTLSGAYFVLRMVLILMTDIGSINISLFYIVIVLLCVALFFAYVQPYKRSSDNILDTLLLTWLVLFAVYFLCLSADNILVGAVLGIIPFIVFLLVFTLKQLNFLCSIDSVKSKLLKLHSKLNMSFFPIKPGVRSPLLSNDNVSINFGSCNI